MGLFRDSKQYTAISADIDELVGSREENPARLVDLIELIQSHPGNGASEAGRALRKKLKYGRPNEIGRALSVVELLVDNGGRKMTPVVTETGLGDAVANLASGSGAGSGSATITKHARSIVVRWSRNHPELAGYATQAGVKKSGERHSRHGSRNTDSDHEAEDGDLAGSSGLSGHNRNSSSMSSKRLSLARSKPRKPDGPWGADEDDDLDLDPGPGSRSPRSPQSPRNAQRSAFPRQRSRSRSPSPLPNLRSASLQTTVATAHSVATRLMNSLIITNEHPSKSQDTRTYYRQAKQLRQRVVQLVHDPTPEIQEYIEQLLNANQDLVAAIQAADAVVAGKRLTFQPKDNASLDQLLEVEPAAAAPQIKPTRRPPSVRRPSASSSDDASSFSDHAPPPTDSRRKSDPFGDDFAEEIGPKHTPMW